MKNIFCVIGVITVVVGIPVGLYYLYDSTNRVTPKDVAANSSADKTAQTR